MIQINKQTVNDIERSILDLMEVKSKLVSEKKKLETQLSQYTARIRQSTLKLPPNEYKDICRKQREVKTHLQELDSRLYEIRLQISKKHLLKEEVKLEIDTQPDSSIKSKLIKLRDGYLEFSSDSTRVSSMRIMASQVAEQIESIIKTL